MLDSHLRFHAAHGNRLILIVDDEAINREMLGGMLEDKYEIIYASSGTEAIEKMLLHHDILSLVLLDLIMPDMHGLEVLKHLKTDERLSRIPVIVMTADKDAEVESLTLGAIDFIPKPYPEPRVVQARVLRTIELSEDRDIIRWTERDQLTGLYNREYFYRYAEQFDVHHKDLQMDAIVVDVNHFHMINERYGKAYGDEVLKRIGERVRDMVRDSGGIVCRKEADTFLVYCPHRKDYTAILEDASVGLAGDSKSDSRVRLRMGIYSDVDKSIDIERRFDRAKMAADTVKSNFTKAIAIYDNALHETEIFAEQLLEDFHTAIQEKQFVVYYQPKFDVRQSVPFLCSAEALVRWHHPTLGLVNPGVFVPLFEKNGLIPALDSYVWREVAARIRDWKDRIGLSVPVSVNVSRIDMFDPSMVSGLINLMAEYDLSTSDFLLEITESAYTQDSEQIIATVEELRSHGFRIEMDDFGTGYSSLNMISNLPIDALKLDIQFVRNAFSERRDTRMLEVIIDIADSLGVPTIAEGVETAEQMFTLKAMGCEIVQGYYFSRPVPAEEYEEFLIKRLAYDEESGSEHESTEVSRSRKGSKDHQKFAYDALHDPVTGLYNSSAFDMLLKDSDQDHIAILIASADNYKDVCSIFGNDAGSRMLIYIADVLRQNFRSVDYICRIGGGEFAVIMTRVNSSIGNLVVEKIDTINKSLLNPEEDVPATSLCAGIAFADRDNPVGTIFEDADTALHRLRDEKTAGCAVFE